MVWMLYNPPCDFEDSVEINPPSPILSKHTFLCVFFLPGIQSGYFFGSGSPLNWDKDLMTMTRNLTASLSPLAISKMAASAAAKLHATFWKDQTLTGKKNRLEGNWRGFFWGGNHV